MSTTATKTERLSCRITPEGKRLLEHVASRHGMNISDYFVRLAIDAASHELMDELVIRIPTEEWENMLSNLDADLTPNTKLSKAISNFNAGTFSGDTYHAPD